MSRDPAADERLSQAKEQLLQRLLRERELGRIGPDEIRRGSGAEAPLSFAQQQLWFLDQMEPGSSLYNIAVAVRLRGRLDVAAFAAGLQRLLDRHDALRTSFTSRDGEPVQRIAPSLRLPLRRLDLSALPAEERERAAEQLVAQESTTPFDLQQPPLLRAVLLRLSAEEHVLSLVVHHIVSDGWSLGLLTGALRREYQRAVTAEGNPTEAAPAGVAESAEQAAGIRYADYAAWQRERYGADGLARELEHWRQVLQDAPTLLELPGDRPRPAIQTFRGAHCGASWQGGERTAVARLSRQCGASDFMTLLAAFAVVLSRHSGATDLVIGVPIAGRTRPEVHEVVGLFVNTLPLRIRVDDRLSFRQLLHRVRSDTLDAYEHQDVPFDRIVDAIVPERDLSHSPLVQVMFELRSAPPGGTASWPGLSLEPFGGQPLGDTAKFDLTLTAADAEDGYEISVEYATDRYDRAGVEDLVRHFHHLLDEALARPDDPLGQLGLLDRAETDYVLRQLNPGPGTPADAPSLPMALAEQARVRPDAVAVVHGGRHLSYGALWQRATELATVLRARGFGPESRVGVCLAKRPELLIAIAGITLAGAAYVPIDPAYPPQRVGLLLADSKIGLLVTDLAAGAAFADEIAAAGAELLDVDRLPAAGPGPDQWPAELPTLDALAYVIYTSGSTGTPRGVQISHRNLAAALASWTAEYELTAADRHLQLASPAFDVFTGDLTRALGSGAALVLVDRDLLLDPAGLAQLADEQQVTFAEFVPVVLRHLAAELDRQRRRLPALRLLVAGSDAWNGGDHARALRVGHPRTRVLNSYGLTETTVDSTYFEGDIAGPGDAPAPIGRPMRHARVYVLDRTGTPAPVGVPGELYVGGPGVGRGYLNRPGRTAASFVPDPFAAAPGARLYRTGDRARWQRSGQLEFLGRLDHQVKLRGFRIELGEVQAVLAAHPEVRSALALVRPDRGGTERLVAYVVPAGTPDPAELGAALRAAAAERLPDYMVPSAVMLLDALPLTPNGKLDTRALPDPQFAESTGGGEQPATESERALAQVWADVLGRSQVGVEDNFFALGGDSIISLQVVARSRAAGWAVTPKQVFEHQTVRGLAGVARPAERTGAGAEQGAVVGPLPLTAIQHELLTAGLPAPHHYNLSVLLAAREPVSSPALVRAVRAVLGHHDALRLRFTRSDQGEWQQYQCGLETVPANPVLVIDLADLDPAARERAINAVSAGVQASFDLSSGILMRAVHFRCGPADADRLMLAAHHLAVDAVSWRILLEDLGLGYRSALAAEPIRLPAKTTSFRDWARRAHEVAQAPVTSDEAGYWLDVAAAVQPLPRDGAEPSSPTGTVATGDSVHQRVPVELTRALLQDVPGTYSTTIDDALLAALAQAFESWTGRRRIVVDSERHGREGIADELDVSRTVGWFTSTHPVLLDLGPVRDQGAMLRRIKEQLRALPRQGVGWGLLRHVAAAAPQALRAAPRADVAFNYLGQFDASFDRTSIWEPAPESGGANHDPNEPREYPIEITALVTQGSLEFIWSYSPELHRRERIEALAGRLVEALAAIVEHCATAGAGGHTPADFPLARLGQDELDALLAAGDVEDLYPLSPLQQGMLFHGLAEPGSGTYLEQFTTTLQGDLDLTAFRAAWRDVLDRHTALRASFHWVGLAEPVQVIHRTVQAEWAELDWRTLPAAEAERLWLERLAADRARGFDLQQAPLLRFALARIEDGTHRFLFSHHHVLLDGWSFRQVLTEVLTAYSNRRAGRPVALAPVRQYRDHIAWLARPGDGAERAAAFWRAELRDYRPAKSVADRRPSGQQATRRRGLDPERTAALGAFARAHQLTLNTLIQAAWALAIGRSRGSADVVHGMTLAGRPAELPGVEDIVGLFINTVPVRTRLPDHDPLLDWLRQVQAHLLEVRQHEATPLVEIKRHSDVPAEEALFDSIVVFENYPVAAVATAAADTGGSGMTVRSSSTLARTNYALALAVTPGEEVSIELTHDLGSFPPAAAEALLARFTSALDAFTSDPAATLGKLELLSETERDDVLAAGRGPEPVAEPAATVTELFDRCVAAAPDAAALVTDELELSYRELDQRANRLAWTLIRASVRPHDRVALLAERGVEQVVATLAILKAGAAYVPMDARYPDSRLGMVLARCGATAVLADAPNLPRARALPGAPVLVASSDDHTAPSTAPGVVVSPDALGYVIFTSGSTGEPKGVAVTHRNIVALALDSAFDEAHRRVLVHSPHAFDASTYELWVPLLSGGTAVLAGPGELTVDRLRGALAEHAVTALFLTTGLFRVVAEQAPAALAGLRQLWTGGDAVPADAIERVQRACPELTVIDVYGPTETTAFATFHRLVRGQVPPASVPIGRPMDGMRAYVLDPGLRLVPPGAEGELYLGGTGLARGYLGQPGLTAARFVPDPWGPAGSRMYRSGDLTAWTAEGALRFAGRRDDQVKVRGFRIELDEIETVLRQHAAVQDAAVTAPVTGPGDRVLVAHVVAEPGTSIAALRDHCAALLPEYMVPARLQLLERLPLTANGKLDRRTLLREAAQVLQAGAATEPAQAERRRLDLPQTPVEAVVLGLFEQAIGRAGLGVHEDFFLAGGHSLAALRLVGRLREVFGSEVALAELYRAPTAAGLAAALGQPPTTWPATLVPLRHPGGPAPLVCVHPKNGTAFCYSTMARTLAGDRAVLGVQSVTVASGAPAQSSIEELASRYLADLLRVQPSGPYHLCGYSLGGMIAYELARQLHRRGAEVATLVLLDCAPRLAGPPFPDLATLDGMDDAAFLASEFADHLDLDPARLRKLSSPEQLRQVAARLEAAGLPAEHMDLDTMARYVEIARAHTRAAITYEPGPYPGRAVLLRCIDAEEAADADPSSGWAELIADLEVYTVPGTHVTMLDEPNVNEVVAQLAAVLPERADGAGT